MKTIVENIEKLLRYCGDIILTADRSALSINEKSGAADFVTAYDKKIEDILHEKLLEIVPDAEFVGEESANNLALGKKRFIVDPIDGTTNFIKDYHMSCISVALVEDEEPVLGIVYNPYLDEMFVAQKGRGAFCNGKPIHVSNKELSQGIFLFGSSPYNEELSKKSFELAYECFQKSLDIRRSGSAALDLCSIAAGRAELYFELILSPWDYAAGSLIVTEAGGVITDIDGNPVRYDKKCSVVARNGVTPWVSGK